MTLFVLGWVNFRMRIRLGRIASMGYDAIWLDMPRRDMPSDAPLLSLG